MAYIDRGDFETEEQADAFEASLCPECDGFGHFYLEDSDDEITCPKCGGTGERN